MRQNGIAGQIEAETGHNIPARQFLFFFGRHEQPKPDGVVDIAATSRRTAADSRAKRTELAHGECLGKRINTDRLEKSVTPQRYQGSTQDLVVIESQGWHSIKRKPAGIGGVVAATD